MLKWLRISFRGQLARLDQRGWSEQSRFRRPWHKALLIESCAERRAGLVAGGRLLDR